MDKNLKRKNEKLLKMLELERESARRESELRSSIEAHGQRVDAANDIKKLESRTGAYDKK